MSTVPIQGVLALGNRATRVVDLGGRTVMPGHDRPLARLSDNPMSVAVDSLPDIQVLATMVGGRIGYFAATATARC